MFLLQYLRHYEKSRQEKCEVFTGRQFLAINSREEHLRLRI